MGKTAGYNKNLNGNPFRFSNGAEDEARTRYLHLGKVALYQMSYSRIFNFSAVPSALAYYTGCNLSCQEFFCKKQGRGLLKKRNRPLSFLQVV